MPVGLRITADGRVATVTVNRPEVLNALDTGCSTSCSTRWSTSAPTRRSG